jgi:hypothetical protein
MLAQQIKEELNSFKMVSNIIFTSFHMLNFAAGDGGSRALETTHTFLLMITHSSGLAYRRTFSKFALVHWAAAFTSQS